MMQFKSQKVDPLIVKKKGRLRLKNQQNYNADSNRYAKLSDNDESNKSSIVLNSENVDHKSDNMDNERENVDAKEIDTSTNSSLEKDNFSDENKGQDQWVGSLKSKLNDRRVQFKRKRDSVGYRINPETDDIAKSLVTPSDFKFLDEVDSDEYLGKWKSLKNYEQKPYSIKRFKPYS